MNTKAESFLTPEELEEERAYFQFINDLTVKNRSRYEKQAELLLKSREFSIAIGKSFLLYTLEDGGCAFRVSKDGGFDFSKLGWTSLGRNKQKNLEILVREFADSEARMVLNR